ncbi:hypothetical protein Bca101_003169 [Brassica carinata]
MDLSGSKNLEEIPVLSLANLEKLLLTGCSSLVGITSSIRNLHKLLVLDMSKCTNLEALPSEINLKSLDRLDLGGCSQLKKEHRYWFSTGFITTCISLNQHVGLVLFVLQPLTFLTTFLTMMNLGGCSSLVELPSSSIQNLKKLASLSMEDCTNLEALPADLNLTSLDCLNFDECSRLKIFPMISNTIYLLILNRTAIKEVPWWINTFYKLRCLRMKECKNLKCIPLFYGMQQLKRLTFQVAGYPGHLHQRV